MKTFRMIGMALVAVLMCVNFAACGGSDDDPTEEPTTDLSKIIIGTWVQSGDDDIMVVKENNTIEMYGSEEAYKNGRNPNIWKWEIKGEKWLYLYGIYEDESSRMYPIEVNKNYIQWKQYNDIEFKNEKHDDYGYYRIWTWERYSK